MGHGKLPSPAVLRNLFDYDADRGVLIRRPREIDSRNWNKRFSGRDAGGMAGGHRLVSVLGEQFMYHRVVYAFHHGDIPDGMVIDHINRDPFDNRIGNLRAVPQRQNQRLISFAPKANRWATQIEIMRAKFARRRLT